MSTEWRTAMAMVFLVCILCSSLTAQTADPSNAPDRLREFLRTYLKADLKAEQWKPDARGETRYFDAYYDLNGDGQREVVVYLAGPAFCGTGGCNLLVLAAKGSSYRVVSNTMTVHEPIRVLARTSRGWRSIGVWVRGGGEAELRFNGARYPRNTSAALARRLPPGVAGEIVLPRMTSLLEGKLLD